MVVPKVTNVKIDTWRIRKVDGLKIENLKKHIFVCHIKVFDSLGIYIGESKEEAFESLAKELCLDVPLEVVGMDKIAELFDIWSWEEYQEEQGFKNINGYLEIIN